MLSVSRIASVVFFFFFIQPVLCCMCVCILLAPNFSFIFTRILITDLSCTELILAPFLEVILLGIIYLAYSNIRKAFVLHSYNNNKKNNVSVSIS